MFWIADKILFRRLAAILVILAVVLALSLAGEESFGADGSTGVLTRGLFGEAEDILQSQAGGASAYSITDDSRSTFLRLDSPRSCAVLDADGRGYSVHAMQFRAKNKDDFIENNDSLPLKLLF